MALLLSATSPTPGQFYFATGVGGAAPAPAGPVVAESFEAIGSVAPPAVGRFVAHTAPGQNSIVIETPVPASLARWGIGVDNPEVGANSGSDFVINRYSDAGALIDQPLIIERATGNVSVYSDFLVAQGAIIGDGTTVGGSLLQVNGPATLGRVYDTVYNRPVAGVEALNSTYGPTGGALTLVQYVAPNTGLYTVTMEVKADANGGFAWTNGVNNILGYFSNPFPPFDLLSDSFLACDSIANPTGMVLPLPGGAVQNDAYTKDIVAVVNLVGGTTYAAQANFNPAAFNLGTTGGIRFFIQPLLA